METGQGMAGEIEEEGADYSDVGSPGDEPVAMVGLVVPEIPILPPEAEQGNSPREWPKYEEEKWKSAKNDKSTWSKEQWKTGWEEKSHAVAHEWTKKPTGWEEKAWDEEKDWWPPTPIENKKPDWEKEGEKDRFTDKAKSKPELRDLINILSRIKHSAEELQVNAIVAKDLSIVLCTNKTDNTRFMVQ